jgi:hypothetical protein
MTFPLDLVREMKELMTSVAICGSDVARSELVEIQLTENSHDFGSSALFQSTTAIHRVRIEKKSFHVPRISDHTSYTQRLMFN